MPAGNERVPSTRINRPRVFAMLETQKELFVGFGRLVAAAIHVSPRGALMVPVDQDAGSS
jgi:hypothetical protein